MHFHPYVHPSAMQVQRTAGPAAAAAHALPRIGNVALNSPPYPRGFRTSTTMLSTGFGRHMHAVSKSGLRRVGASAASSIRQYGVPEESADGWMQTFGFPLEGDKARHSYGLLRPVVIFRQIENMNLRALNASLRCLNAARFPALVALQVGKELFRFPKGVEAVPVTLERPLGIFFEEQKVPYISPMHDKLFSGLVERPRAELHAADELVSCMQCQDDAHSVIGISNLATVSDAV